MKHPYNTGYFPPIPAMSVRLHNEHTNLTAEMVEAILDTASDVVIVPSELLIAIHAIAEGTGNLRSPLGGSQQVKIYFVDMEIDDVNFPGVWVVGDETSNEVVLGRSILNRMKLLLDGLKQQTEMVAY